MEDELPVVSNRNVIKVIEQIRSYQQDARLLLAGKLLERVDEYVSKAVERDQKESKEAVKLLEKELKASFDELRQRAAECIATLNDWHSSDWILAQTFMGITTSYKHDHDGSIWVKLSGKMDDVRVVDQLATVREVDLYRHWIPFCDKSRLLKRIGVVEVLAYFNTAVPGVSRDCVLHAYGCDAVLEEKCILIQGKSVDEWDGVDLPKAEGWRHGRLDVRAFRAKIEVLSPTSASTSIVANIDPKAPLPKTLVNFTLRKVAGMLLYCMQQTAGKITTDEDSRHRSRILEDEDFYHRWLYPRISRFYRKMGWPFDGGLARDRICADSEHHIRRLQGSTTEVASVGCCMPRRRRGNNMKLALERLWRKQKRSPAKPVVPAQLQVEILDVEPRLLKKWQMRRDSRRGPGPRPSSLRLLFYVFFAACAVLGGQLSLSLGKAAYRFRGWLITFLIASLVCCVAAYA